MGRHLRCIYIVSFVLLSGCDKIMHPLTGNISSYHPTKENAFQPGSANISVVIVAGQSNAVGQGAPQSPPIDGVSWQGLPGSVPRGIGMSFGEEYLRKTGRSEVIIAMCAVGGTTIAQWQPGGVLFTQCTDLYQTILDRNPGAQIAAVLFWQGESDEYPTLWTSQFSNTARGFQRFFNAYVPIVFGETDSYGPPDSDRRYIQAQQAAVSLPIVSMVQTADVQSYTADHVHLEASGLDVVGRRMAQAYFGLLD